MLTYRALASELLRRAGLAGQTFDGKRTVSTVCGYKETLTLEDYRQRYKRNEIAARVIEAMPKATWRGGGELVEDPDPDVITPFEEMWHELDDRLNLWPLFQRADILAGLGQFSVLLIGAPGPTDLAQPLPKMSKPEDVVYVQPFAQYDVTVSTYEQDYASSRYGLPLSYRLRRQGTVTGPGKIEREIHWTRILHVADGLLDDTLNGIPRLERVWNRLDDLEKVVGGGAEAFWKRADQGLQIDVDPAINMTPAAEKKFQDEVDEYLHGLSRILKTRGVEVNPLGSDVANFAPQVDSIVSLISAGTGIPQRILLGSERGELASSQDRENWNERVADRRTQFAGPMVVRPFVQRLTEAGLFPPVESYDIWWPAVRNLTELEKATLVQMLAQANASNSAASGEIITADELRDLYLELAPLDQERPPQLKAARRNWRKRVLSIVRQTDTPRRLSA